jgi:hypothetical protein
MASLESTLVDLGTAPPSNAYLTPAGLKAPEKWSPLKVLICELEHSERYAARISSKLDLGRDRHVAESRPTMVAYFNISRFGIFHAWVSNRRQVPPQQHATGHYRC